MAIIEAVLIYRPHGIPNSEGIPLGATADIAIVHALRDVLLHAARTEAAMWRRIDPGLATMKAAELARLVDVLAFLLPETPPA